MGATTRIPLSADGAAKPFRSLTLLTYRWLWVFLVLVGTQNPGMLSMPCSAQEVDSSASGSRSVLVLEALGHVDRLREGRRYPALPRQALLPEERLQTSTNSHASVRWYDGMVMQLTELSDLLIPAPPKPRERSVLELIKGALYLFHRSEPQQLELRTPSATALVLGTEFSLRVLPDGITVLTVFEGQVELSNPQGSKTLTTGQQGVVRPGNAPELVPVQVNNDLIQWFLYYPAILDPDDLELAPDERNRLRGSLEAYRSGDLRTALALFNFGQPEGSSSERLFRAMLLLAAGGADAAENALLVLQNSHEKPARIAHALRHLIQTVKGDFDTLSAEEIGPGDDTSGTSLLAASLRWQARGNLSKALDAATNAAFVSPKFGAARVRVAELQFGFGRIKEAKEALQSALSLAPKNAYAIALHAYVLSADNQVRKALALFDQSLILDGRFAEAWLGYGLCQIRLGNIAEGQAAIQTAASLEPQRSLPRSYLAKAFGLLGQSTAAHKELALARLLDRRDPTPWFYSALLNQADNRINQAIQDMEQSISLNSNRRLYRSQLLLDQDRSVRSANLATIYRDAGLTEFGLREASRGVSSDYANYSAHLFLAESFNQLRDPRGVDLRYETPAFSEYLMANLLAPVGAGNLSPSISQQEYSKLFEQEGLRFGTFTEYGSRGDWSQSAVQYGLIGNTSYAIDAGVRLDRGQRANNNFDQATGSVQLKQQFGPQDTVFLQASYLDLRGGDGRQVYDPAFGNPISRVHLHQQPNVALGYRHEWSPGNHTLLLVTRMVEDYELRDPLYGPAVVFVEDGSIDIVAKPFRPASGLEMLYETEGYSVEAQQILSLERGTWIFGGRVQELQTDVQGDLGSQAGFLLTNRFGTLLPLYGIPASVSTLSSESWRFAGYSYYQQPLGERLKASVGLSYERARYPLNTLSPPFRHEATERGEFSPKAGLVWELSDSTSLRVHHSRSLGATGLEQSYRIEPTQIAGFNQAYRSLIPESVAGANTNPRFQSYGMALDYCRSASLFFRAEASWLHSAYVRHFGTWEGREDNNGVVSSIPGSLGLSHAFDEPSLDFQLQQLLGQNWSVGARYRISQARLELDYDDIPLQAITSDNLKTSETLEAIVQRTEVSLLYRNRKGYFAQILGRWWVQSNTGYPGGLPGEDLFQIDMWIGRRFWKQRGETSIGILNLSDQDYRLNPLNLLPELSRERALAWNFRFLF